MSFLKWSLLIGLVLLLNKYSIAQGHVFQLTPSVKTQIISTVSASLIADYVYPDTAVKMSNYIQQRLKSGAYSLVNDPAKFAKLLTIDLLSVFNDGHLSIRYAIPQKEEQPQSYMQQVIKQIKQLKAINAGFVKAEILPGNIGYVKFDNFSHLNEDSKETINNAFSFVRNSNFLILDLRHNGGGDVNTELYICGLFFKVKTHTTDFYNNKIHQTIQYWTEPHQNLDILTSIPIYVLVSNYTGSAAELFAYDLQTLHRATIVGEVTKGAANAVSSVNIGNGFEERIPYARAINRITGTSWEGIGVKPDVKIDADKAIEMAMLTHFDHQINTLKDSNELKSAKWTYYTIKAKANIIKLAPSILKTYVGVYGDDTKISYEKGNLYMTDGYKQLMVPISKNAFIYYSFKITFIKNTKGQVIELDAIREDGKVHKFMKQKLHSIIRPHIVVR